MLYLLPNLLDDSLDHKPFLPPSVTQIIPQLNGLIVESLKGGRRFLKRFIKNIQNIPMSVLNIHTTLEEIALLSIPIQKGEKWGLLSDAGLPVLADPGAKLVHHLNALNIPVHTFPGPSSIIYALQLSGLSAQSFTFHGYLPQKSKELRYILKTFSRNHTHICIETPYRTFSLLHNLIAYLPNNTLLSVAWNLTLPQQKVYTQKVMIWKKKTFPLNKAPAVFLWRN